MTDDDTPSIRCADCGWEGIETDANWPEDLYQRLEPGDICPSAECPECGALCFPIETKPERKSSDAEYIKQLEDLLREVWDYVPATMQMRIADLGFFTEEDLE